jgi:hypothetical protein
MICGTFTMTDIPDAEADVIVASYKSTKPPPTSVTKTKEADGSWTVVATYPPCPATTTHAAGS